MRSFKRWLDKLERPALIFDNRFGAATSGQQCGAYRPEQLDGVRLSRPSPPWFVRVSLVGGQAVAQTGAPLVK